jgi:hypothetical protein
MKNSIVYLCSVLLLLAGCSTAYDSSREVRNNWASYIHTAKTEFKFSALGGIAPFEVPVKNNTDYFIDEVIVEVDYVKTNGNLYKSEKVTVRNIPPHSVKMGTAPKSPRGIDIDMRIVSVFSRDLKLAFPGNGMNPADPYLSR